MSRWGGCTAYTKLAQFLTAHAEIGGAVHQSTRESARPGLSGVRINSRAWAPFRGATTAAAIVYAQSKIEKPLLLKIVG